MTTPSPGSGPNMPPIGFGTWQLRSREAALAVTAALAAGYRLIDTARIYMNERAVGAAISGSGLPRDTIFLTTKLWNMSQGYRRTHRAFSASLKRLRQEYVDLYLIHWPMSGKRQVSWKALEEIFQSGRARAIGVSNYTVRHLAEMTAYAEVPPAVNQVEFHPFIYREQQELLEYCRQHGIIVEAYSPLARGEGLSNPVINRIAGTHGKTGAQVMLRWAVQHGTIPIPKAASPERVRQNIEIFDFTLSDGDMRAINGLSDGRRTCWNPERIP